MQGADGAFIEHHSPAYLPTGAARPHREFQSPSLDFRLLQCIESLWLMNTPLRVGAVVDPNLKSLSKQWRFYSITQLEGGWSKTQGPYHRVLVGLPHDRNKLGPLQEPRSVYDRPILSPTASDAPTKSIHVTNNSFLQQETGLCG